MSDLLLRDLIGDMEDSSKEMLCAEIILFDKKGRKVNLNVFVTHIDGVPEPCWPAIQEATRVQVDKIK